MSHTGDIPFFDAASFQAAVLPLREATFNGQDLSCDPSGNVTLALSVPAAAAGGLTGRRAFARVVVTVCGGFNYRQSLIAGPNAVYILDRAEIGRGGHEIAFYFRPGDRAVMDVERIEGSVRHTGERVAPQTRPTIANPLATTAGHKGLIARLLGRS